MVLQIAPNSALKFKSKLPGSDNHRFTVVSALSLQLSKSVFFVCLFWFLQWLKLIISVWVLSMSTCLERKQRGLWDAEAEEDPG